MSYIQPENEEFLPDEVRYPTAVAPTIQDRLRQHQPANAVVPYIDRAKDESPPWIVPSEADYSRNTTVRPAARLREPRKQHVLTRDGATTDPTREVPR